MPSAEAVYAGSSGSKFRLVLTATLISQSSAGNFSVVRVSALLKNVSSSTVWNSDPTYANYQCAQATSSLVNTSINGYGNLGSSYPVGSTWSFAGTHDYTIYHASDGTRTANFYAYHNGQNLPFLGEAAVSFNYTLPTLSSPPTVTTTSASNIQATTVQVGGNVTDTGNATITQRGIYYAINDTTPTSENLRKTVAGTSGAFTTTLTALFPNQKYYYRAYAINARGISYGVTRSFTTTVTPFASLIYDSTEPYADGVMLRDTGSLWQPFTGDLYFKTYSAEGATTVVQNSLDPSTMLINALDFFNANDGIVTYDLDGAAVNTITNIITNPSMEDDIDNWTANQGFITRTDFSSAPIGTYNFQLQNSGGGDASMDATENLETGETYTFTYYAQNSGTAQVVIFHDSVQVYTNSSIAGSWTRYSGTFVATADLPAFISCNVSGSDQILGLDGMMLYKGDTLVDYFDGSTVDAGNFTYEWNGTANASTSTRTETIIGVNRTIDETNTTSSYTFITMTVLEVISKILQLSPNNWFWYIDPSTNLLYFKVKGETPDHNLILGKDIIDMQVDKRGENIVNVVYFTGGDTGGGSILYKKYQNVYSIGLYGQRATKIIDERVTNPATAQLISENYLNRFALPEIRLRVTIADSNYADYGYDIESIQVGDLVNISNVKGSTGSSLWDVAKFDVDYFDYGQTQLSSQNLQVVRKEYKTDSVSIICSNVPPEVTKRIEDIARNLENAQTVNNPSTPT